MNERDWPEDFHLENGNYTCMCSNCGYEFTGLKRRVVCKCCSIDSLQSHLAEKDKALGEANEEIDRQKAIVLRQTKLNTEALERLKVLEEALENIKMYCSDGVKHGKPGRAIVMSHDTAFKALEDK